MKVVLRLTPIALTVLMAYGTARAADPRELEVRRALDSFAHCWEAHDASCMDKLLSSDFTYIFRAGQETKRAEFLGAIKDGRGLGAWFGAPNDAVIRFYGPVAVLRSAGAFGTPATYLTMIWSNTGGKGWQLVRGQGTLRTKRIEPETTTFASANDLANALRRAEAAHKQHEARTGQADPNWPDWYAEYMVREQAGKELPQ